MSKSKKKKLEKLQADTIRKLGRMTSEDVATKLGDAFGYFAVAQAVGLLDHSGIPVMDLVCKPFDAVNFEESPLWVAFSEIFPATESTEEVMGFHLAVFNRMYKIANRLVAYKGAKSAHFAAMNEVIAKALAKTVKDPAGNELDVSTRGGRLTQDADRRSSVEERRLRTGQD